MALQYGQWVACKIVTKREVGMGWGLVGGGGEALLGGQKS